MIEEKIFYMLEDIYQSFIEYNSKIIGSRYNGLNLNEIHAIDYIEKNDRPNVTRIAAHLKVTRGAVTKLSARMKKLGYIDTFMEERNKKEKYFLLTPKGREMYLRHEVIHKETIVEYIKMYKKFKPEELEIVSRFLGLIQQDFTDKLNY